MSDKKMTGWCHLLEIAQLHILSFQLRANTARETGISTGIQTQPGSFHPTFTRQR